MTRKDYILLAETLRYARPSKIARPVGYKHRLEMWETCVEEIARALKSDNGAFEYVRFYTACGKDLV